MRLSIIHSVALGLAGLRAAEASVCKPRSLSSDVSAIASATLIVLETTSSGCASESSMISSTIVSEVTTEGDTSTTDAASESASTIEATTSVVSASTEVTSTAESTIATQTTVSTETGVTDTTTAPTSLESTGIIEATTTTTAEHPVITDFRLKGSRGSVEGAFIYSNGVKGSNLVFSGNNPAYSPALFSIEALTGRLVIDNSLYVCALFRPSQDIASLGTCNEIPESSEVDVICTPPAKNGDTLSCSVPGLSCSSSSMCTSTGEILTDTSTDFNYNVNENVAVIGQISNGVSFVVHAL